MIAIRTPAAALGAACTAGLLFATPVFAQDPPDAAPDRPAVEIELPDEPDAISEIAALRAEIERMKAEMEAHRRTVRDSGLPGSLNSENADEKLEIVAFGGDTAHVLPGTEVAEVVAFGGDVLVDGHVLGDATSFGGKIRVRDGGHIDGDAVAFGGRVIVEDGGFVRGSRINMAGSRPFHSVGSRGRGVGLLSGLYNKLVFLLSFAGAGVLVVGLFPARVGRIAAAIETRPLRSVIVGSTVSLFLTVGSVLFAITVLGIPVSFVLVAMLGLAWLLGFVGLCQALGDRLPFAKKPHGRWIAFLVGCVLITFLGALPFVGWLTVLVASVLGIGAAFSTRFGGR